MRKFLAKHAAATTGTLSCFDRLLFKGHLPLGYPHAMEVFLTLRGVLFKRAGLAPRETPPRTRLRRQDPPLPALACHPARPRRHERRRTATRGRLPQRVREDRRVKEKISVRCRELAQEDSTGPAIDRRGLHRASPAGLTPVPASFRTIDPTIPPDSV